MCVVLSMINDCYIKIKVIGATYARAIDRPVGVKLNTRINRYGASADRNKTDSHQIALRHNIEDVITSSINTSHYL